MRMEALPGPVETGRQWGKMLHLEHGVRGIFVSLIAWYVNDAPLVDDGVLGGGRRFCAVGISRPVA